VCVPAVLLIRLGVGFNSSLSHEVASVVLRSTLSWIRKVHFHLTPQRVVARLETLSGISPV